MIRALRVALCCLVVATLVGSVVPVAGAPPPRPLCDACGDSFEETAELKGITVGVERSDATITVHENGSATWVVRNRLGDSPGVERLRANASLRADIAERAMRDAEFLDANLSSAGVLTMRYRDPDFAERSVGGVLRSGAFTESYGYRNLEGLGADRLVVVAPDGMQVDRTVPDATASDDGQRATLTRFGEGGFVTFVPDEAVLGPVLSILAIGSLVGPAVGTNLLAYVAFPTVTFGLFVGGIGGALADSGRDFERIGATAGQALVVFGVLATGLALLAAGGVSLLGGLGNPVFGIGIAAVAFGASVSKPAVRNRATYRRLVAGAALGVLVAAGATLAGAFGFDQTGPTRSLFASFSPLIPVFALFPAGYAFGRGKNRLTIGTATVGFALSVLPFAPLISPPTRFGPLVAVLLTAYAAVVTVFGTPLLVVGMSLAASSSSAAGEKT